jgi:hypothetical protein
MESKGNKILVKLIRVTFLFPMNKNLGKKEHKFSTCRHMYFISRLKLFFVPRQNRAVC